VILLVLHRYGQQYAEVRPELATLEAASGLSRRGVQAALARLRSRDLVQITRRYKTTTIYRLSDVSNAHFVRAVCARKKCAGSLEISSPVSIPSNARSGDSKGSTPSGATRGRTPRFYQSAREAQEGQASAEPPRVGSESAGASVGGLAAAANAAAAPHERATGEAGTASAVSRRAEDALDPAEEARIDALWAALRKPKPPSAPEPTGAEPDSGRKDAPRIDGLGFG